MTRSDLAWLAVGAAVLFSMTAAIVMFRRDDRDVRVLASKAGRVDLVTSMRAGMAAASEAEKSAMLAAKDDDAQAYADQSRAATAEAEKRRDELAALVQQSGTPTEKEQLESFSRAFADLQKIDEKLLSLAARNSNWKAYAMAFGPAAQALGEMDGALTRVAAKTGDRSAFRAQISALRIETLLPPHISEESDAKMNELEARMTEEDRAVRTALAELRRVAAGDPDVAAASTSYDRFSELRTQILVLSRENTNVRSTAMSLREKRKAMLAALADLDALEQSILAEAPMGEDYGRFGRPR